MGSYIATWEDEENNRQIQFSVEYTAENGTVEIAKVTPTKVSFICPESNTCLNSVRVHTATGRTMLANHFRSKGNFGRLALEIAERTQESVSA